MAGSKLKPSRAQLFLAVITVAALAPFLHKAFGIDDPLFLWMAEQIARHPFDPYGFEVNWGGSLQPMWIPMQNPPLGSYYIAAVVAAAGWGETALHTAFLLPAVAAILGTHALARRFCPDAQTAALLTLFTPVFLVSATNVMCDVMLVAFWVWSIECWLKGLERREWWPFATAAFLAAGAVLTKYFGISVVPLLFAYTIARERRLRLHLFCLLIPVGATLGYELWTQSVYGHGLFGNAMIYLRDVGATVKTPFSIRLLTGCSFVGGCLISSVCFFRVRRLRNAIWTSAVLAVGFLSFWSLISTSALSPGNALAVRFEGGIFAAVGAVIVTLALLDFYRARDAESLLLSLWILGTLGFSAFLNWSITARTILPAAPAVAILVMRHVGRQAPGFARANYWRLGGAAAISMLVAFADYRQAGIGRSAARHFRQRFHALEGKVSFQSHWGFQWYMQRWGATPVAREQAFSPGNVVVIPSDNADPIALSREAVASVGKLRLPLAPMLSTFAPGTGAGFYSSVRGPVPWMIGRVAPVEWEAVMFR